MKALVHSAPRKTLLEDAAGSKRSSRPNPLPTAAKTRALKVMINA